jgi:hypothetical protein
MSQENTSQEAVEQTSAPVEETQADESNEVSETSEAKEGELQAKDSEEGQAEEPEKEESEPKPKKKSGVEKRIDKLTKQRETERLEKEYWKAQALKGQNPESNQSQSKPEVKATAKPKADDFDSHEAYVEALVDWKAEEKIKAERQQAKDSELKSQHQKQVEAYSERARAFAEANPDFDDVIAEADDVRLSITVQDAILRHGPELAYEMAKDIETLERICKMSPLEAAEEIGEIRARMKSAKAEPKPEQKLTKAPKPLTPIASKSAPVRKSIFDEDLPFSEYERMRRDQLRKRA